MDFTLFILVFILIFNIVMWIVFGVKFKKKFSTDEILKETRHEMNQMLTNINVNAERNIQLIDAKIEELKKISYQAESNVQILRKEIEKIEKSNVFINKVNEINHVNYVNQVEQLNKDIELMKRIQEADKKIAAAQVKKQTFADKADKKEQLDLFNSEITEKVNENIQVDTQEVDSDAVKIDVPEFYKAAKQIEIKKDFNQIVQEYKRLGYTLDEIAQMTSRSVQEVKLSLALS